MTPWEFLIEEPALASVVTDEFSLYRPPIRGALALFLEGLSSEHQQAVLAAQAALPSDACPSTRLVELARSCPALHKLGQVVARDRRLSANVREKLQALESLPPAVPIGPIEETLARELGPLDRLGVTLQPPALAEASVAVVIPFEYHGHDPQSPPREGVFKLLKPGIETRLDQELQLFERVGEFLDRRCGEFGIPTLDYQSAFEQVRQKLAEEIRLDHEQEHLARAALLYKDDLRVQVPALFHSLCTPRVTAMERVHGSKVTDHALTDDDRNREQASTLVSALVARPIFSDEERSLFHGDPHAGNLFWTDDGRLALLDWSLAGELGESDRSAVVQVVLGALLLDADHVVSSLASIAERGEVDRVALEDVVSARLGRLRRGEFPGFNWLIGLLDDSVERGKLRPGPDLMLFRKMLHTLEGVIRDVGGQEHLLDQGLQTAFVNQFAREWPGRWLAPLGSRAFATRLSNADLAHALLSLPLTATRFWVETGLDLLTIRPR